MIVANFSFDNNIITLFHYYFLLKFNKLTITQTFTPTPPFLPQPLVLENASSFKQMCNFTFFLPTTIQICLTKSASKSFYFLFLSRCTVEITCQATFGNDVFKYKKNKPIVGYKSNCKTTEIFSENNLHFFFILTPHTVQRTQIRSKVFESE